MSLISTRTISTIRTIVNKTLDDTCTIEKEGTAVDSMGAPTHTWSTVATAIKCRIIRADTGKNSNAGTAGSQETIIDTYRLILPVGTVLAVDYRVTINNAVYHVVAIDAALTGAAFVGAVIKRAR